MSQLKTGSFPEVQTFIRSSGLDENTLHCVLNVNDDQSTVKLPVDAKEITITLRFSCVKYSRNLDRSFHVTKK